MPELHAGNMELPVEDNTTGVAFVSEVTEMITGAGRQEMECGSWVAHKKKLNEHDLPREGTQPLN